MLVEGIDHLGLALYNELKEVRYVNPRSVYYFQCFNCGVEIIKNSFSVVENHVLRDRSFFHVVTYNWKPDFKIIKDIYLFDYQRFKSDKWNRRFTIGDFSSLEEAVKCFNLVIKCFVNEQTGNLF